MCGIAGILNFKESVSPGHISGMADILRHRGPDDEGYLAVDLKGNVACPLIGNDSTVEGPHINRFSRPAHMLLAHRRLSIIDPSPAGHQPMSNREGTLWIIYNGEIYNYLELREELGKLNYSFRTNTDTEVLLAAYEQWGMDCLAKFNGMWAFVIYDRRKNVLFGARDRFGVKPFYYYKDHDLFAFASEIKAIAGLPFVKTGINRRAVFDYLVCGYQENEEEGVFRNIFELGPSCAFSHDLKDNTFKKWKYYTLQYTDRWERYNQNRLNEYSATIRALLFDAVKLRLRSDVPVGSCLSGGIDSTAIVCIINNFLERQHIQQIGEKQKVFTVCHDSNDIDESRWAKIAVERSGATWFKTTPTSAELLEDLEDLVYTQDTPFSSTSIYTQYRIMRLAKKSGIKVLLDGQGGDELFTGYSPLYGPFFIEMLKHLDLGRCMNEWKGLRNSPIHQNILLRSLLNITGAKLLPTFLNKFIIKLKINENNYINKDFWNTYSHRLTSLSDKAKTSLNQKLYDYMVRGNLKSLLRYEDRNTMRFSIESRTPFADDIHLIEYVFQIPSVYKIHNGWSKYLLREATKGILPEQIRLRKDKIGFATPEHSWLKEIKDNCREILTHDISEFLDVDRILRDWDKLLEKRQAGDFTGIWKFINLAVWQKVYGL